MRILSITGTASGVGKTTVARFLLRRLSDFSALKITTKHEGNCPRHSDCDVCETMKHPFTITVNPLLINQSGKDTAIFKNAGARKVVWLQAHSEHLKAGVDKALGYFKKDDSIIIEGNSFLHVYDADLCIMVTTPRESKIKRSTLQIIPKIDMAVVNKYADDGADDIRKAKERFDNIGCRAPVHIVNPFEENSPENELFLAGVQDALGHPIQS